MLLIRSPSEAAAALEGLSALAAQLAQCGGGRLTVEAADAADVDADDARPTLRLVARLGG